MPIPTRTIAKPGLAVTVLGFGTAPLGDLYEKLDDATAIDTVGAALRAGIGLVDTSPHYGNGLAEHRVGTALRRVPRDSFVLSTKVGRWMNPRRKPATSSNPDVISPGFAGGLPHAARFDYSYDGTLKSFEQSLLRLGLDRIDILLIHDVDVWTHGEAEVEVRFREAMEGAYRALDRLRGEGVVKAIGVGINEAPMCERFARAGDFDVVMMAGRYTLLEQGSLDTFLPVAVEKRIGVLLAGVFNSGILATGIGPGAHYDYAPPPPQIRDKVARIEAVCRAHGVALRDAALHFALAHPAVASLVLGAVRPAEIEANVASLATRIPLSLWSDLKTEGLIRPDAPTPDRA